MLLSQDEEKITLWPKMPGFVATQTGWEKYPDVSLRFPAVS